MKAGKEMLFYVIFMNLEKLIHSVAASMELYVSFTEGEFVLDFCLVVSIPISTERSNE